MDNESLLFPRLDAAQIACLCSFGDVVELPEGTSLFREGEDEQAFFLVLEGQVRVTRQVAGDEVMLTTHGEGEFTGTLGVLAAEKAIATGIAATHVRVRRMERREFIRMIAQCDDVGQTILAAMSRRRPEADALLQQRERLAALGKLSAGLAHELNNPAAAAQRASEDLRQILDKLHAHMTELVCVLPTANWEALQTMMLTISPEARSRPVRSPLDCSDAETAIGDWLEERGVQASWEIAPTLADAKMEVDDLVRIASTIPPETMETAIRWGAVRLEADSLLETIGQAVGRISTLVAAVKSYSYMDQAPHQEINIVDGIESTLTMLQHKMRKKSIEIVRNYAPNLPRITAYGGELNQVWTNLFDNAIDALPASHGKITIEVAQEGDDLCITIADNGPGIPLEIQTRIFEPFFTTKAPGEGTGLGLDVAYRIIVTRHHGDIRVTSEPGSTRFLIRLPLS